MLGRAAPMGQGLLKFLSCSITPAANLDGCIPRCLLQSQASNLKDKYLKAKGNKLSITGTFVVLPSFVVITAGSIFCGTQKRSMLAAQPSTETCPKEPRYFKSLKNITQLNAIIFLKTFPILAP